jgi:hypothetical protein
MQGLRRFAEIHVGIAMALIAIGLLLQLIG